MIQLDDLLTVPEAAKWFRVPERTMRAQIAAGIIPAVAWSRKMQRIHPRTVLAKLATDGGASLELVQAAFTPKARSPKQ